MRLAAPLVALSVVLTLASVAPAEATAASHPVTCGAHISGTAVLTHDLHCGSHHGLTLNRGATLDLHGHRLVGPGKDVGGVGITTPGGGTVTIEDGRVDDGGIGLQTDGNDAANTATTHVFKVVFDRNSIALNTSDFLHAATGPHVLFDVTASAFMNNGDSVWGTYGRANVSHTVFTGNTDTGVYASNETVHVTTSIFIGNATAVECLSSVCTVTHSNLNHNDIAVHDYENPRQPTPASLTVTDNRISYNTYGINTGREFSLLDVERNSLSHNQTAVTLTETKTKVIENTFTSNGLGFTSAPGVDFPDVASTALLVRNLFQRNSSGIRIPFIAGFARLNTLRENVAVHNNWGIRAPGATDGGGNIAFGNGKSPQCVGVVCS